jgi:hypothetical protein
MEVVKMLVGEIVSYAHYFLMEKKAFRELNAMDVLSMILPPLAVAMIHPIRNGVCIKKKNMMTPYKVLSTPIALIANV